MGDFPFTTLSPQLGVVYLEDREPLVVAEIPGLIAGAHQGKGLGHRFLRHLKRTRSCCWCSDVSQVDPDAPLAPLKELEEEMQAFDPESAQKTPLDCPEQEGSFPPEFPLDQVVAAYRQAGEAPW